MRAATRTALLFAFVLLTWSAWSQTRQDGSWSPRLLLEIRDCETGERTAARFSIASDGEEVEPRWIGPHGLRFASVHVSKRQTYIVTYARGTGVVEVPLAPGAKSIVVRVAKGFDFRPVTVETPVTGDPLQVEVCLQRWHQPPRRRLALG